MNGKMLGRKRPKRVLEFGGAQQISRFSLKVSPIIRRLRTRSQGSRVLYFGMVPGIKYSEKTHRARILIRNGYMEHFPYKIKDNSLNEVHSHMVTVGMDSSQFSQWKDEIKRILRPGGKLFFTADTTFLREFGTNNKLLDLFDRFYYDSDFRIRAFFTKEFVPSNHPIADRLVGYTGWQTLSDTHGVKYDTLKHFTDEYPHVCLYFIAEKRKPLV